METKIRRGLKEPAKKRNEGKSLEINKLKKETGNLANFEQDKSDLYFSQRRSAIAQNIAKTRTRRRGSLRLRKRLKRERITDKDTGKDACKLLITG